MKDIAKTHRYRQVQALGAASEVFVLCLEGGHHQHHPAQSAYASFGPSISRRHKEHPEGSDLHPHILTNQTTTEMNFSTMTHCLYS